MTRRAPIAWYLGLIGIVVISAVLSVVLIWSASGQQILVDQFYTSQTGSVPITDEQYRYWDAIARSAYQQVTVVAPTLLTGASASVSALLAVLAFRWERRRQLAAATSAVESAAAS